MMIRTERLTVRPVVESDWDDIRSMWEDIQQTQYARFDTPKDTENEAVQARIARWAQANRNGTDHLFFSVCLDSSVIGYISLNRREDSHEIGYCFHSLYHGRGFAKESHLALIHNLHKFGIHKLTARTALENIPSVNLLKWLGFKLIGTEQVSFYKTADGKDIVFDGGIFALTINSTNN